MDKFNSVGPTRMIEYRKPPMKKLVCGATSCTSRVAVVVGTCNYCKKQFCVKHRLPEAHCCEAMELCKQISFDRNATKLVAGKCVHAKV